MHDYTHPRQTLKQNTSAMVKMYLSKSKTTSKKKNTTKKKFHTLITQSMQILRTFTDHCHSQRLQFLTLTPNIPILFTVIPHVNTIYNVTYVTARNVW